MTQTLGSRTGTNSPDATTTPGQQLNAIGGVEIDTASGAIAIKEGTVILNGSGALAMTLAVPASGAQPAGDDGRSLCIIGQTAHAHTVTTPANGINGADHIETFSAAGDVAHLVASGGTWIHVKDSNTTLS